MLIFWESYGGLVEGDQSNLISVALEGGGQIFGSFANEFPVAASAHPIVLASSNAPDIAIFAIAAEPAIDPIAAGYSIPSADAAIDSFLPAAWRLQFESIEQLDYLKMYELVNGTCGSGNESFKKDFSFIQNVSYFEFLWCVQLILILNVNDLCLFAE